MSKAIFIHLLASASGLKILEYLLITELLNMAAGYSEDVEVRFLTNPSPSHHDTFQV